MITSKWHMHRMGLVDFWYYTNEEFLFDHGHMLLRGSNGSGKSVTMQSFIPLLLDGNKSSERLDSFGTRSRKIENYLLEEDGERNERIGYLYLEFKRADSDVYQTIGMGLRARRNKAVDAWYFVIEDNRRINIDIFLMQDDLAITKQMLKHMIGNQLIETQKEYMARVNQALFHFPTNDDYKEAIQLLVQLRSPKLSNSLKPTVINEILRDSLQPLSDEDLRPMSEAISNMDDIKDQLDALKESHKAAKAIIEIYDQYNHAVLKKKLSAYIASDQKEKQLKREHSRMEAESEAKQQQRDKDREALQAYEQEQMLLQREQQQLMQEDVRRLAAQQDQYQNDLREKREALIRKQEQEETKDNLRLEMREQARKKQEAMDVSAYEIRQIFRDMEALQERMQFAEHEALRQEMMSDLSKPYDITYTNQCIQTELSELRKGLAVFEQIKTKRQIQEHYVEELERLQASIDSHTHEQQTYIRLLRELIEETKEQFALWQKENRYLKLDQKQMQTIFQELALMEEEDSFDRIEAMIRSIHQTLFQSMTKELLDIEQKERIKQEECQKLEQELHTWESMRDPKPDLSQPQTAARDYLSNQGIPFVPLYERLEFAASLSERRRNVLEESLEQLHLLHALLVRKSDMEKIKALPEGMSECFLISDSDIAAWTSYTIDDPTDHSVDISKLAAHFRIRPQAVTIDEYGYRFGSLWGIASRNQTARFIGRQAREQYRQRKLEELREQLAREQQLLAVLNAQKEESEHKIEALHLEEKGYSRKDDMEAVKRDIRAIADTLDTLYPQVQAQQQHIDEAQRQIRDLRLAVGEIADHLGIVPTTECFEQRKDDFEQYEQCVRSISYAHGRYQTQAELYESFQNQLEDLEADYRLIREERGKLEQEIAMLEQSLAIIRQRLAEMGYDKIAQRMEQIQQRLRELPELFKDLNRDIGKLSSDIDTIQANIQTNAVLIEQIQKETAQYYLHYQKESELHYVFDRTREKDDPALLWRELNTKGSDKALDALSFELQQCISRSQSALQEYGLNTRMLFGEAEGNARLDISARYKGTRISFLELLAHLQEDMERQSALLADSDRNLIEDILVNTISRKIRTHIQSSRRWVASMNRYMDLMNTSSTLKLNLQWKSRKAENEDELNSEQLVALLEKDVRILKEADLKRLSNHFRSRIATARKLMETQDLHSSFHQIMRDIMDYRNWFEFRIRYEKSGESRKELTNNAFYAFSGGEKAMSMYVPLFSAVAAKFAGAGEDAPRLIALDEAFAGVDEKNIDTMFDLIDKFDFDYIMNSQVLWGDYPSVKHLAIHELFRPENAHFVTVITYRWNGRERLMVER